MNVINVLKPFHVTVIYKGIKEHILERNLTNKINVVKSLQDLFISTMIKEHIPDRNLINVINVVKYIQKGDICKFSVLEENLLNIIMN